MSDRSDRKLQQVPLASYNYRHEAEFAGGFLQDAGIPFRLQIEDPTLGLSATNSATIWVSAMNERKARQVLEHELATEVGDDEEAWVGEISPDEGAGAYDPGAGLEGLSEAGGGISSRETGGMEAKRGRHKPKPDLTLRQRILALGGGAGVSSILGLEAVRQASTAIPVSVALLATILVLAGVFGWAPGPLRRLLGALAGDAP